MDTKKDNIYILAIESSCDDTSAAVLRDGVLLSNVTASQAVHEAYGGVVPELASRAHQQNVVPVVDQALKKAGVAKEQLSAVAFTRGPGLMGSLLVGVSFAKGFARALGIPLIDVNHLQGHVMAHFIKESDDDMSAPPLPFLCLLVSGGNSQIVKVNAYNDMEVLGQTIDDAAGEAIDKCSKVMGLGYPGGPIIDRLARQGNPQAFKFAEPQIPDLNYSFSGLDSRRPRLCREEQSRHCSQPRVDHCRYSHEETAQGRKTDWDKACCRSRRSERKQWPQKRFPRPCQALRMDYLHTEIQLHYRQCRHDRHRGTLQVSRQAVLRHQHPCIRKNDI